ncbi:MAG TPA: tripartite tricarboxylate transporter TctB family protein [Geminicoccaceae bacterium]|nr:tripartite tricarboxylate transporter TctB family protein [Geminicoccaceae bacterium]
MFSILLMLVAAAYAAAAIALEVPFQYEPLGPKAWPIVLAVVVILCAVRVLLRPDPEPDWPSGALLTRALVLLGGLLLYAALFETLGFMITTTILCAVFALALGAHRLPALAFALLMGVPGYYLWTRVLQLNLPLGEIFH